MAAAGLGIEAEPAEVNYREIEAFLRQAGPALLRLPEMGDECVLALLGRRRRSLLVLGPDLMVYLVCAPQIRAAVWGSIEAPLRRNVRGVLDAAEWATRVSENASASRPRSCSSSSAPSQLLTYDSCGSLPLLSLRRFVNLVCFSL
jgi:hypothetical protein